MEAERTNKALLSAGLASNSLGDSRSQRNYAAAQRGLSSVRTEADRTSSSMSLLGGRWAKMTGLVIAALPALTRAGGVLVQFAASLAQAAGGAGVVGGGALGLAAVGVGSLLSVLKPMETQLKTSKTAFDAYSKAVDMYGARSKQAATSAKALNEALKNAPKGTLGLLTTVKALSKEWTKETRPAQNSLMGMMLYGARGLQANSSQLAGIVNGNVGAIAGGGKTLIDRLLDPTTLRNLQSVSAVFRGMVPNLAGIGGDAITSFFQLLKEAAPYVASITADIRTWADHFDRSTQDTEAMDERFKRWTTSFKSWLSFLGGTKDLLSALLGSATGGNKELAGITASFESWAKWIRTNPVKMQRFWEDSLKFGQGFGDLLVYIGKLIFGLSAALSPAESAIAAMLKQIGPEFLQTLKQVAQLMQSIFGGVGGLGGPLSIFLKLLNVVLEGINGLIRLIPGLGPLIAAAFTVVGVMRLAAWVSTTTSRMLGLAAATNEVAAAQARVGGTSALGGGGGGGGGLPMFLGGSGRRAAATGLTDAEMTEGGVAVLGGGKLYGSITRPSVRSAFGPVEGATMETTAFPMETAAMGFGITGGAIAASRVARLAGVARGAGRVAGKVALPLTIALGAMDAYNTKRSGTTAQRIAETTAGVLHGATFGLTPTIETPGQAQDKAVQAILQGGVAHNVGGHTTSHLNFNPLSSAPVYGVHLSGGRDVNGGKGLDSVLARSGGSDPTTLKQIAAQIAGYTAALRAAKGLSSAGADAFRTEAKQSLQALKTAQTQITQARSAADFNKAFQFGHDVLGGYNVINAKQGPVAAMKFVVDQSIAEMKNLGPRGKKELASGLIQWGSEMKKDNPALADQVDRMTKSMMGSLDALNSHTKLINNQIFTGTSTEWAKISTAMMDPVEKAKEQVSANFTAIQQKAVGSLTAMGYSASQSSQIVAGLERGDITPLASAVATRVGTGVGAGGKTVSNFFAKKARGGRIGGSGLQDSVMVGGGNIVAPGELVVNRHTEARVNRMLGQHGTTLGAMVSHEGMPHSAPMKYAKGGRTGFAGMGSLIHGLLPDPSALGGVPGMMVDSSGLIFAGGLGAGLGAIASAAGSGGGGGVPRSRGGKSKLRTTQGIPSGNMSFGNFTVTPPVGHGPMVNPGGTPTDWLRQALQITGNYSSANLAALYTQMQSESGGDPSVVNEWDSNWAAGTPSKGLLQTIDSTFSSYAMPGYGNIWDPIDNTVAAIRYMLARYHGIVGTGHGYAKGGRVPWYGDGADFVAKGPQVIGVGEKGEERVRITPKGRAGYKTPGAFGVQTPAVNIPVTIEHLHYGADGDVSKVLQKEIGSALRAVTREIQNVGLAAEEQLVH